MIIDNEFEECALIYLSVLAWDGWGTCAIAIYTHFTSWLFLLVYHIHCGPLKNKTLLFFR